MNFPMRMNCAAYSHPLIPPMPNNNSNSMSALSRQMKRFRNQLDRIDFGILNLLQQRNNLSRRIGEAKRRHGAVIYVPERERELLRRMEELAGKLLPPRTVSGIYREILSSSRAAQRAGPIGLHHARAADLILPARWCFGSCDEFVSLPSWKALADGLLSNKLAMALVTVADLQKILRSPASRQDFLARFFVAGDFSLPFDDNPTFSHRVFIVTPREGRAFSAAERLVILIECKFTDDAVKSWIKAMSKRAVQIDHQILSPGKKGLIVRLHATEPLAIDQAMKSLEDVPYSVLGVYGAFEDHAR